jgi:hypothetical protein
MLFLIRRNYEEDETCVQMKLLNIVPDIFIIYISWNSLILAYIQFFCKQLDTWGVDGEVLHVNLPSEEEVTKLVSTSEKQYKERLGMRLIKSLPGQFIYRFNLCLYYT